MAVMIMEPVVAVEAVEAQDLLAKTVHLLKVVMAVLDCSQLYQEPILGMQAVAVAVATLI
ncbi:MAG: hypothetical protein CBC48_07980 [bacterium TMED88]|nr:MAG: hypothetical protein CBC48_07980 [bacterium TMED88]